MAQLGGPQVDAIGFALDGAGAFGARQRNRRRTALIHFISLDEISLKQNFILQQVREAGFSADELPFKLDEKSNEISG